MALGSVALYLAGAMMLGMRLTVSQPVPATANRQLVGSAALGLILHGALLYQGVVTDNGLNLGFFNSVSLIAWVVVLLVLAAALTKPVENLGIVAFPLAAISIILSIAYSTDPPHSMDTGLGIQTHAVVSIVGFSVLTIAACQSVLLAVQEHQLRHKRPGRWLRILPPMQTQETLLFQLLAVGFFFLSLSLVSGIMFVQNMLAQHLAHKTLLAIAAWIVFALLLWGRWQFGWRGRTAIRWSLSGFCILAVAYLGSKLVLEVVLGRFWSQV